MEQRDFFLRTDRIGFSTWRPDDAQLARQLWGDPQVTRYICASGAFSDDEVIARLHAEIEREAQHHVQYWPIFALDTGELIGCCGLRPREEGVYELGFHLRPAFWGRGYADEAARAAIDFAFSALHASALFAGHHPKNAASGKRLLALGFRYLGDEYYAPTGLQHPSYLLRPEEE